MTLTSSSFPTRHSKLHKLCIWESIVKQNKTEDLLILSLFHDAVSVAEITQREIAQDNE
jgi:hypothetical protein